MTPEKSAARKHARELKKRQLATKQIELALKKFKSALHLYASAHESLYDSPIGEDYVLGECWRDIAHGLVGLLNGERGTIDGGEFSKAIHDLALKRGFSKQETDEI